VFLVSLMQIGRGVNIVRNLLQSNCGVVFRLVRWGVYMWVFWGDGKKVGGLVDVNCCKRITQTKTGTKVKKKKLIPGDENNIGVFLYFFCFFCSYFIFFRIYVVVL